jgi:hypothetical protein
MTFEILIFLIIAFFIFLAGKFMGTRILVSGSISVLASVVLLKYLVIDSSIMVLSSFMTILVFIVSMVFIYKSLKGFVRNKNLVGNLANIMLTISSILLAIFVLASYFYFIPEDYYTFSTPFRDLFFLYEYELGIFFLLPFVSFMLISKGDK